MRISVDEVKRGLGRWVARVHNQYGEAVLTAFSNVSEKDAEDQLLCKIFTPRPLDCNNYDKCETCPHLDNCIKNLEQG